MVRREREREGCRTLGNPVRMIRRCFFPIVVTLPPFSSRLLTSVAHCDAREATFATQALSVSIQKRGSCKMMKRVLTTSRGTLVLDHFPRHSGLRPCQTLGRSSQVASKDKSSTAMVMRASLCRQLTFVSAAIFNTTRSPEEQTRSPLQLHRTWFVTLWCDGQGGIQHTICAQEHQKQPPVIEPTRSQNF